MGILTLLRNAFGRSRKARTAEAEGAAPAADPKETAASTSPEPNPEPTASTPESPAVPSPSPEPTPASTPAPAAPSVPEPRDEHDLVSAAFDSVAVPKPARPDDNRASAAKDTPSRGPGTKAAPAAEPDSEGEPEQKAEQRPEQEQPNAEQEPASKAEKPEQEPVQEPKAEPTAEAEVETKGETEPKREAEPEPQPQPQAEQEREAEREREAETKAEPEPEPEQTPETEPKAETETTEAEQQTAEEAEPASAPEAGTEPAPALPEGKETPQEPSTGDSETGTNDAGSTGAPTEAATVEDVKDTPVPAAAEGDAPDAQAATPAEKLRDTALAAAYEAAGAALGQHGLTGTRAKVHLVLDRSASMRPYYKDGSAQALAEQVLSLAAHLDTEATLQVTFFSTELDGTGELTLTDHENKINELHAGLGRMGRTSYHAAVEAVLARHAEEPAGTPALVIFQTDGAPDAKTPATQALRDAAKDHPTVFFSFVAFGEHENKAFDYLRKLKTGNTSFFHAGPTPRELTDTELYQGVLASWRP